MLTKTKITRWWEVIDSANSPLVATEISPDTVNLTTDKYLWGNQQTALMRCSGMGWKDLMTILLSHSHINVDQTDEYQRTALFHCVRGLGGPNCAKMLLEAGCNVNIVDKDGKSPIVFAVEHCLKNEHDILLPLLEHGAQDVDLAIARAERMNKLGCLDILLKWKNKQTLKRTLQLPHTGKIPSL